MAEATCNMGGLGYTGLVETKKDDKVVSSKHVWNSATNVNIMGVEVRIFIDHIQFFFYIHIPVLITYSFYHFNPY